MKNQSDLKRRDLLRMMGIGTAAATLSPLSPSRAAGAVRPGAAEEFTPPVSTWRANIPFLQTPPEGLRWFNEAKFGMFIHWGPVSLASVEISWPIMVPSPKWNITEQ
ncbi:MAG: alpha-L-fucosidase, partial [Terriglobia bacterium]